MPENHCTRCRFVLYAAIAASGLRRKSDSEMKTKLVRTVIDTVTHSAIAVTGWTAKGTRYHVWLWTDKKRDPSGRGRIAGDQDSALFRKDRFSGNVSLRCNESKAEAAILAELLAVGRGAIFG